MAFEFKEQRESGLRFAGYVKEEVFYVTIGPTFREIPQEVKKKKIIW